MKYIGVVQVRYDSPEFPGKSLAPVGNGPALEYLLARLRKSSVLSAVVIATSSDASDDVIEEIGRKAGAAVYRGDKRDVIGRLYGAAEPYAPEGVVKFMGNAPLVDIEAMEVLVRAHRQDGYDYAYNEHSLGVIYGMGCSVFSFKVLKDLALSKELSVEQREIGSLYIRQHPEQFRIFTGDAKRSFPAYRVLIDERRDVELVNSIIKYTDGISNDAVGRFLDENQLLVEYQRAPSVSETGLEKLYLFPGKVGAYIAGGTDATYPVSVELSLTNQCNFDCVWCSDVELRKRLGGEFTLSDMERLFADLKAGGTTGVVIEGGGEPMIHKEFGAIVKCAAGHGLSLGLITNGSVPMPEELIRHFEWIRVSLDAATPGQHAKAKKVQVFEKVLKNIKNIGAHKGKTTVGVGYVVTNENIPNLENLILRLRNYNVDYIQLRPVIDTPELAPAGDISYLRRYETPRFKVDVNAMAANAVRGNAGVPCVAHSLSAVITADGGVYLCGRLNIYDWVKPVGNLHKNSFREIWLGEERRHQAEDVARVAFCGEHCPECRMTKYNLLVNRIRGFKTRSFI